MLICRKYPKLIGLSDNNTTAGSKKPTLLLVEDNLVALKMIQTLASQENCGYLSADSGEKALQLAMSHAIDLIITDLGLPDISGLELTQKIRQWEISQNRSAVPIIGLTVHAMNAEALNAGMDELLIKPLQRSDLQKLLLDYGIK